MTKGLSFNIKVVMDNFYEDFEKFWEKYPKKIKKKEFFEKFKREYKNLDLKNFFLGLDLYVEKWKKEDTPTQFIMSPVRFLNDQRYYDEITIQEENKKKNEVLKKEIEENKRIEKEKKQAIEERRELIYRWNRESKEVRGEIYEKIKKEPYFSNIKEGIFKERMKEIYILKFYRDFLKNINNKI